LFVLGFSFSPPLMTDGSVVDKKREDDLKGRGGRAFNKKE